MGIKHHLHHHIKESPCLHSPKSKKMASKAPSAMCCDPAADCCCQATCSPWPTSAVPARLAATPLQIRWLTPAKEELPVVTRPAAVPRGHVGPAPVVEETRHAVKGL